MLNNLLNSASTWIISPSSIDFTCRTSAVMIGSSFSPAWALFKKTIAPWINVNALYQPEQTLSELFGFYQRVQTHRELIIDEFIPQLLLCFILSISFLYICNRVGHYAAQYIIKQHLPKQMPI